MQAVRTVGTIEVPAPDDAVRFAAGIPDGPGGGAFGRVAARY
ncbi:hypothetical protein [Methylobacterium frigidaeris]|nr:hypothetical protein [Methylobacterium frigidaeris]